MSHAGMAPVFDDAREIEPGRYQAHLRFEMAGDWVILLHVTLPGGQKLERQIQCAGAFDRTRQAVESLIHSGPGSSRSAAL